MPLVADDGDDDDDSYSYNDNDNDYNNDHDVDSTMKNTTQIMLRCCYNRH